MRIAIISRELPPHGGGIGSWSSKASRGLTRLGSQVHLFTELHAGELAEEVVDGVYIHRLRPAPLRPYSLGWAWAVAKVVSSAGNFDVVQACEWDAEALVCALRPVAPLVTRLAAPHYMIQHTNEAPRRQRLRSSFTSQMERLQALRSRRVISPSSAMAKDVSQKWGIEETSIAVVPTGIDPPQVAATPLPAYLVEAPYMLYFGRLEVRKGVDVLIDALPSILSAHREVHCVFIGEDMSYQGMPYATYAQRKCTSVFSRIHFLPRMAHPELFRIVANARLVAIPSRWENFANTCLEAIMLGRPIIATSGSGFNEVLTDGVDGLLVPPGDSVALAEAAVEALGDPSLLERLGAAARLRARDFTVDRMASRLMEIYGELTA